MAETILGMTALNRRLTAVANVSRQGKLMVALAKSAQEEAAALVPKKTGNLKRTIHIGETTATAAAIVASANYARYVEYGTGAHDIRPKTQRQKGADGKWHGGVLAWPASAAGRRLSGTARSAMYKGKKAAAKLGGWQYAMVVHHPGTHAHPYMLPGARAAVAKSPLRDAIVIAWNDAA